MVAILISMSILAERKRKQRISIDPQNLQWSNRDSVVAKNMMSQMGWVGGGLGKSQQGATENLRLRPNMTGGGLKSKQEAATSTDALTAHNQEFEEILSLLNTDSGKKIASHNVTSESECEQNKGVVLESKFKSRYHRFKKSKDASRYTGEEMAGIVGHGPTNVDLPNEASTNSEKADGMTKNQITSKQNINDYFAMKMAEKRAKMSGSVD